jgi:hypothetical protein
MTLLADTDARALNLETKVADARRRVRQDKTNPLLISTQDASLWPNVPRLRVKPHMIVYRGDPKADEAGRRAYVDSMKGGTGRRAVINSAEAFDIGKATKDELIDFALTEYEVELKITEPIGNLRKQVQKLAESHNAMVAATADMS